MLTIFELKQNINNLIEEVDNIETILKIKEKKTRLQDIEAQIKTTKD